MFQDEYKKAYNQIEISQIKIEELKKCLADKQKTKEKYYRRLKPFAVMAVSLFLFCILTLPVLAEQIPGVYQVIRNIVPEMAEYILPQKVTCTSNDITLQIEAVKVVEKEAEIILSFRDAEGSEKNQIYGRIDLYDSYRIVNYGETWQTSGCDFLEYDFVEDKAYFKVMLTSDMSFQKDKVKIVVNQILTRCEEKIQEFYFEDMIINPKEKQVVYSGVSGISDKRSNIPFFITGMQGENRVVQVMDLSEQNTVGSEELYVTGIAYEEGVLRVQQHRGNFQNTDRHIRFYLKEKDGKERIPDASVCWQEESNGEDVLFEETWFLISEKELENCELFGEVSVLDNSIKGEWEVIVNLEEKLLN